MQRAFNSLLGGISFLYVFDLHKSLFELAFFFWAMPTGRQIFALAYRRFAHKYNGKHIEPTETSTAAATAAAPTWIQ